MNSCIEPPVVRETVSQRISSGKEKKIEEKLRLFDTLVSDYQRPIIEIIINTITTMR